MTYGLFYLILLLLASISGVIFIASYLNGERAICLAQLRTMERKAKKLRDAGTVNREKADALCARIVRLSGDLATLSPFSVLAWNLTTSREVRALAKIHNQERAIWSDEPLLEVIHAKAVSAATRSALGSTGSGWIFLLTLTVLAMPVLILLSLFVGFRQLLGATKTVCSMAGEKMEAFAVAQEEPKSGSRPTESGIVC